MTSLKEIEADAMILTPSERAILATRLLQSLPPMVDEDDGDAEALRRDAEMDADPSASPTLEKFIQAVGK